MVKGKLHVRRVMERVREIAFIVKAQVLPVVLYVMGRGIESASFVTGQELQIVKNVTEQVTIRLNNI